MKSESINSPRTSAGISKSLLTPCRRLGLARRRPTSSPLTPQCSPAVPGRTPCSDAKGTPKTSQSPKVARAPKRQDSDASTPIRTLGQPRKQKSKNLISAISKESCSQEKNLVDHNLSSNKPVALDKTEDIDIDHAELELPTENDDVSIEMSPVEIEEKEIKLVSLTQKPSKQNTINVEENSSLVNQTEKDVWNQPEEIIETVSLTCKKSNKTEGNNETVSLTRKKSKEIKTPKRLSKRKSGDLNLTRKCMIVIEDHVLKSATDKSPIEKLEMKENFDESLNCNKAKILPKNEDSSDIDDVPLSEISKNVNSNGKDTSPATKKRPRTLTLDDDDSDFCEKSIKCPEKVNSNPKVAKLEKTKNTASSSSCERKKNTKLVSEKTEKPHKSTLFSDSEDDDFDCRKTILVRKSYPKPLHKAKSTGSVTQKDIEDIKIRIKMKRNELLAKSSSHNITELKNLITKWRKGCQEALMELLDIMKKKVPEKQNMNTAELLKMLNIPTELVKYNADDDFFISPN